MCNNWGGFGGNNCIWILIILICCGGLGNSCGGCGCGNNSCGGCGCGNNGCGCGGCGC